MNKINYLIARIREPSTWSGIGILTAMMGVPVNTFGLVQQVVMGLAGLYAVFAPEKTA